MEKEKEGKREGYQHQLMLLTGCGPWPVFLSLRSKEGYREGDFRQKDCGGTDSVSSSQPLIPGLS